MSKLKKFIVIDFEGKSPVRPYNVGIVVGDKHGNIYRTHQLTFSETFEENLTTYSGEEADLMTHKNISYIYTHQKEFRNVTIEAFTRFFFRLIEIDNITEVWAYNMVFDKSAFRRLIGEQKFAELSEKVNFYDIIPMITPKLLTKKYVKYCLKNRYLTKANNLQTTAEIVYRYLFNNINYIERHLGLQDAIDEYNILYNAFRQKKKLIKKYTETKPYIQLNVFCKENNIIIK